MSLLLRAATKYLSSSRGGAVTQEQSKCFVCARKVLGSIPAISSLKKPSMFGVGVGIVSVSNTGGLENSVL